MTIPFLSFQELKDLFEKNGWKIVSNSDWETHNRVMIGKDGHAFPLQIKDAYYYPFVIRICKSLEIEPPEEHLKCYQQYKVYLQNKEKGE